LNDQNKGIVCRDAESLAHWRQPFLFDRRGVFAFSFAPDFWRENKGGKAIASSDSNFTHSGAVRCFLDYASFADTEAKRVNLMSLSRSLVIPDGVMRRA